MEGLQIPRPETCIAVLYSGRGKAKDFARLPFRRQTALDDFAVRMQQGKILKPAGGNYSNPVIPVRSRYAEFKHVKSAYAQPGPGNPAQQNSRNMHGLVQELHLVLRAKPAAIPESQFPAPQTVIPVPEPGNKYSNRYPDFQCSISRIVMTSHAASAANTRSRISSTLPTPSILQYTGACGPPSEAQSE